MSTINSVGPPVFNDEGFTATWKRWLYRLWARGPKTVSTSLAPSAVGANTTSEQTFTVSGLGQPGAVFVNKPTHQAGLGIVNVRVSAKDQIAITFMNTTAASITPTTETYTVTSTS